MEIITMCAKYWCSWICNTILLFRLRTSNTTNILHELNDADVKALSIESRSQLAEAKEAAGTIKAAVHL